MRPLFIAAFAFGALGMMTGTATAEDGCSYDYNGRVKYCAPGAQPGVPYYGRGHRQDYRAYDDDDRRYEKPRKRKCRGGISIGGGSARVCIRL